MPFLEVSVKMLAECPLGSFAMLLLDASLKIANTQADLAAWGGRNVGSHTGEGSI